MSSKVWVAQYRNDFDYTMANDYGVLEVVTHREVPRSFIGPEWVGFKEDVDSFIRKFDEETDYVLFSGNPQQMITIAGAMAGAGFKEVRTLKWMKRERRYVPVRVPLQIQ